MSAAGFFLVMVASFQDFDASKTATISVPVASEETCRRELAALDAWAAHQDTYTVKGLSCVLAGTTKDAQERATAMNEVSL